ncbi:MAG: YitT family protein [Bacilli bacterium]|nr:YitT family protein [Bacilli bacterium]
MNIFSKNKNLQVKQTNNLSIKKILQFLLGCFMLAISYSLFIAPNNFVPGGVAGISVILNSLFNFPNAPTILIVNLLLLGMSFIFLGKKQTMTTIAGTIIVPIMVAGTEHLNVWIQLDTSKVLLSAIMGGIIYGVGLGLVLRIGYNTGGTTILNEIISKYFKVSIGKSMILSDGVIVLLSGVFLGIDTLLYSILMIYIISMISDRIVIGISRNKMFYIISQKDEEIKKFIHQELKHNVTIFQSKGGYNSKPQNIIMTVIPTIDYYELKTNIMKIDKDAFFIITDSYELYGGQ